MTVFVIGLAMLFSYLVYRNYVLEKRWQALRYCWHSMSNFAGDNTLDDGLPAPHWEAALDEQRAFMQKGFGVGVMTNDDLRLYESALLERGLPLLVEHKAY